MATTTRGSLLFRAAWLCSALLAVFVLTVQSGWAANKSVTIGYQLMDNPWKVGISNHEFEKATGYHIKWVQFSSGSQAVRALASNSVKITSVGSVPLAAAISNGVPAQLFWVLEGIANNEQLVIRNGSGVNIHKPSTLAGKRLGVPVGSTSDLDLYYALKNWGVKAHVLDMQPNAIVAAWSRGNIDGAFVWDPALSKIKETGKVMISSGDICQKSGICTFDGLAVNKHWANAHPKFMVAFVKELDKLYKSYVNNPKAWTPDSKMVKDIVALNGANAKNVPHILAGYQFLTIPHQLSSTWLGGGAAKSLAISSKFLKQRGEVDKVLKSYAPFVTAKWVKRAAASH